MLLAASTDDIYLADMLLIYMELKKTAQRD